MPYYHCSKCQHEWEGIDESNCDWCGAKGYILEERTPLEKMCDDMEKVGIEKWFKEMNINNDSSNIRKH